MLSDRRLIPILDGLKAGRAKVLSVDVFDTLLWRRVPEPRDVFLLLGRRHKAAGLLAAHVSPLEFADLRTAAEKRAREKKEAATGYREIRLADIYAELPDFLFAPSFAREARAAAELELESSLMLPDRDVAALMAAARSAGVKVVLASDTYFSAAELSGFLARAFGAAPACDRLFVSCEIGKPKWRDLFDVILKEMNVAPAELVHIGDTLEADVLPCRLRGIPNLQYDKWSFAPRVQSREFPASPPRRAAMLGDGGDFGLTGLRSRLFHRAPSAVSADLQFYWGYGAAMLAPAFAAFARWVVGAGRQAGISKIYGLMREGRFLNRIVNDTAKHLGVAVTTQELWLSRRAVVRAAMYKDEPGLVPEFAMLSPGRTTDDVLAEMGLTRADLAGQLPADFDLNQADSLINLCRAIGAVPAAFDKVLAVSARHRRNLLRALKPVLAEARKGPVAMMDLGYAATIQAVLEKLLAREGEAARFTGLYLALNAKAMGNLGNGADLRGCLNLDGFNSGIGALLTRTPYLLEHASMCREGSLSSFDDNGAPVLLPNQREDAQLAQMEALQDGIAAGVAAINELLGDLDQTPHDDEALKLQAAASIEASHLYPTRQEAQSIGAWKHEAKIDFTAPFKLTDLTFDSIALEYGGWPALQGFGPDQVYWPAAAFVLADPFIADAHAGGATGVYHEDHLKSGPVLGILTIRPDRGEGFDAKADGHVHLSVNVFGRGLIGATVKPLGSAVYKRLQFHWPRAWAVAQIDRITLTFIGENGRRTSEVLMPPAITWSGTKEAVPGVHVIDAGGAEMTINIDPPPWPHSVELAVRYKYLRLEGMFGRR